ncbi:hypothetical protein LINPERPRIM_LOCUS38811 [Linum perenne]
MPSHHMKEPVELHFHLRSTSIMSLKLLRIPFCQPPPHICAILIQQVTLVIWRDERIGTSRITIQG